MPWKVWMLGIPAPRAARHNRSARISVKPPAADRSRPAKAPAGPATVISNSSRGSRDRSSSTWAGPPPGSVETRSSSTRSSSATHAPPKQLPDGSRQGEGQGGPERVDGAPRGIVTAPHRPPAYTGFRAQPLVLAALRDPTRKETPDDQRLGHVGQPGQPADAHPEIVVLRHGESRIISARPLDDRPARHHGGVHEGIAADERAPDTGIIGRRPQDGHGEARGVHL